MASSRTRLVALLAAAVVVQGCRTELSHGLGEAEANRVVATLAEHGIPAEIVASAGRDGPASTVVVPATEAARARIVLSRRNLPGDPEDGLREVFDRGGLVPSPTEEQARLVRAIQGELEQTLESLDRVVAARVHLSMPEAPSMLSLAPDEQRPELSASVVLRYVGSSPPVREDDVRGIVAGAVSSLAPERVAVLMLSQPDAARPRSPAVVPLGPFSVSPASVGPLRLCLGGSFAAVGILGTALMVLAWRMRTLRRQAGLARASEREASANERGPMRAAAFQGTQSARLIPPAD
jgi:type III secretion protein J